MSCTFSFNPQRATTEMACLWKFLDSFPPYPRPFFHRVQLIHVDARSLHDLLGFVQHAILLTGCSDLVLSNVAYEELRGRGKGVTGKKKRTPPTMVLPSLRCLGLTHFDASPLQWAVFLSSFYFPSLHSLDVSGASSICAIFDFLDQHPTVRILRFFKCSWKDIPSSSRQLGLLLLHALQGYPRQILSLLRVIASPPVLSNLVIEVCPPTRGQCDPFVDKVMDVLKVKIPALLGLCAENDICLPTPEGGQIKREVIVAALIVSSVELCRNDSDIFSNRLAFQMKL